MSRVASRPSRGHGVPTIERELDEDPFRAIDAAVSLLSSTRVFLMRTEDGGGRWRGALITDRGDHARVIDQLEAAGTAIVRALQIVERISHDPRIELAARLDEDRAEIEELRLEVAARRARVGVAA